MMNKILKTSLAAVLFIFATASFAAPSLTSIKMARNGLPAKTALQGENKTSQAKAGHYFATEIHIVNNIPDPVYITIPGSNIIHEIIYPNENIPFYSDDYFDYVRVVLFDVYNCVFFDGYLPNYQTLFTGDYYYAMAAKRSAKAK